MVPKRTLEKLCYYRRRATKAGPVEIALASETNFDRFFDALLRLHAGRWNARGTPGVLADAALQQFHREAARRFLALGALRLHLLRLGNREIAALYCFKSAGRTYYYLGGFDQEFSHLSPGSVLIGHAIETAVREGDGEFDFLRGQEAYKYAWGATDRFNHRLRMWHSQSATADHHRGSEPGKDLVYGSSTRTNQSAVA